MVIAIITLAIITFISLFIIADRRDRIALIICLILGILATYVIYLLNIGKII